LKGREPIYDPVEGPWRQGFGGVPDFAPVPEIENDRGRDRNHEEKCDVPDMGARDEESERVQGKPEREEMASP
jgi:hypothetical protein